MRPLVWFRADLRVDDNPALHHACASATRGVVAVFLLSPAQWREHDWGGPRVDMVLRSLAALRDALEDRRIGLLVETAERFDDAPDLLLELALKHECEVLVLNREHELNERRRDERVASAFVRAGLDVRAFTDQLVVAPGAIRTNAGDFYSVFTPFKRSWIERVEAQGVPAPLGLPRKQPERVTASDDVPDALDGFAADDALADEWPAGEREASRRLKAFARSRIEGYAESRDDPGADATSRLSPYLASGAISPRRCLATAVEANGGALGGEGGAATWISELVWREFYRHVMVGAPRVCMHRAYREETDELDWRRDEGDLERWAKGETGVPIVDAGMRQLAATGWMHNRLRMIVSMYLAKDLYVDWRWGERHFMRRLVDGDLASNNGGWQWSASTGTDAAPYFRIFNPYTQGAKCDPDGAFVRAHVPELEDVPAKAIHDPVKHADVFARCAGDYPEPMVDHKQARERVLEAFKALKG